jgi:vancomycin resistance protein YoaR
MLVVSLLRAHARRLVQAGIIVGAGVAVGLLVVPPTPTGPDVNAPAPTVLLLGEPLDVGGDKAMERALERVRKYASGSVQLKLPSGERREVPRAQLGAEIDKVYLAALVSEARDPTSPMRREHQASRRAEPITLPTAVVVNATKAGGTLLILKEELDRQPEDARLDLTSRKLVPEVNGFRVDVYATLAKIDDAFRKGEAEVDAVVETVKPDILTAGLGNVTFDEVLGYFETRYATDRKHEARTYNLRLAASKLDGHIIPPGAVFDFNKVVGPRNEAGGYRVAPVIAQGELVDGIGGGTCQITGTLHGAVFFSGLEIVSRTPHTRPSAYIKMGLDAAVAYPTINFRFKNPFPFPVVVHETVKDGVVRAEVLGPRRDLTVTFIRKIDDVLPFQEVEKPDSKLPEGAKVLGQRGIPGFKLHRYRVVRDGAFAVREHWSDTYPPTAQVIRVGTGRDLPRDAPLPADDQHPEYTADEYLSTTQGPGVSRGQGDMIESREPGRTGQVGWTEKAGMSHWNPGSRTDENDAEDAGGKRRKPGARSERGRDEQGDAKGEGKSDGKSGDKHESKGKKRRKGSAGKQ